MQNLRNFLIAFFSGLVLFGILASTIPPIFFNNDKDIEVSGNPADPDNQEDNNKDNENQGTESNPSQDSVKTFTAVVGGYDADSGELDGLIFIKADKENKRFVVAAVPTFLSVTVTSTDPATQSTVKTAVRIKDFPKIYRGTELNTRIVDTMHAITGMEIDYYAFFDTADALKIFDMTGGLYYTVPQDMTYIGKGTAQNPEISLKAGAQVLGSSQILGLLRFSEYTTDERRNNAARAELHADFVSEALKQILKIDSTKLIDGVTTILSGCDTNFTVADFKNNFELISKFSEYSANSSVITVDLANPLEYSYSQKLFENYK